jgi:hypothetical protein
MLTWEPVGSKQERPHPDVECAVAQLNVPAVTGLAIRCRNGAATSLCAVEQTMPHLFRTPADPGERRRVRCAARSNPIRADVATGAFLQTVRASALARKEPTQVLPSSVPGVALGEPPHAGRAVLGPTASPRHPTQRRPRHCCRARLTPRSTSTLARPICARCARRARYCAVSRAPADHSTGSGRSSLVVRQDPVRPVAR